MIAAWMLQEGYKYAHPYGFQLYDSRFVGLDQLGSSEIDVYIPVIRQERASDVAADGSS
jgi:predicted transcriptional regulator YdeE